MHQLSDICEYAKGKVNVSSLDRTTYVSTENMLPNKGGVVEAANLPSMVQTQAYEKNDVLVSNIRPYFKKIWYADKNGGCSNDVLVFRGKKGIDPEYLYYILANNAFFEYSMATSKGTKMPRGDKKALMEFAVPEYDTRTQRKIANVLRPLDKKINMNNMINKNLELQAQALYKAWFIDFEPFGGIMPSEWSVIPLGNIATIKTNSFSPIKSPTIMLEHYSIPSYDENRYPVFELAENVKSNKYILTKASVLISKLNPDTKRIWRPFCLMEHPVCSTEFIVYEAFIPEYKDFIYSVIDSSDFSNYLCAHTTGSTNSRQRVTPSKTLEFQVPMATNSIIQEFCDLVTPMYDCIASNICENQQLSTMREFLLPKLMSSELDVSKIDF